MNDYEEIEKLAKQLDPELGAALAKLLELPIERVHAFKAKLKNAEAEDAVESVIKFRRKWDADPVGESVKMTAIEILKGKLKQ